MKIIRNRAKCLICQRVVESKSVHDFQQCACGNLFVDGGRQYLRRGIRYGPETVEELNEIEDK